MFWTPTSHFLGNTTTKDAKTKKTLVCLLCYLHACKTVSLQYKYKYLSIPLVNGTVNTSNSYCQSSTGEYDGDFTGQLEVTWEYENQDYRVDFMFSEYNIVCIEKIPFFSSVYQR